MLDDWKHLDEEGRHSRHINTVKGLIREEKHSGAWHKRNAMRSFYTFHQCEFPNVGGIEILNT